MSDSSNRPPPPLGRLRHGVPGWVPDGSLFHIRIRALRGDLTSPPLAAVLLASVGFYHEGARWYCPLFLLMPDHLHALLSFPRQTGMSETIRAWKAYHTRVHGVVWQDGYFDHRLRGETEIDSKAHYIRANPVVKGLCATPEEWPHTWPR